MELDTEVFLMLLESEPGTIRLIVAWSGAAS